jgi:hypothetical protein
VCYVSCVLDEGKGERRNGEGGEGQTMSVGDHG